MATCIEEEKLGYSCERDRLTGGERLLAKEVLCVRPLAAGREQSSTSTKLLTGRFNGSTRRRSPTLDTGPRMGEHRNGRDFLHDYCAVGRHRSQ
ncbi:hypothetical protein GOP47_0005349 [Adiantum capillus-veneris]|uniref:Uncharacterized protein n=1 Tax=Adiantum capillus-veneris TaxID=13818 RepID=A0A9D4ZP19_ADICA|nr:hypothetical protein GOP47_0005349 [Adiantum capillus-veneris]